VNSLMAHLSPAPVWFYSGAGGALPAWLFSWEEKKEGSSAVAGISVSPEPRREGAFMPAPHCTCLF